MRYSYEFKLMCVDMYREGKWPDTPAGVKEKTFHDMVRVWAKQEAASGSEGLKHRNQNREWTADEKYEYVARVLAGESYKEIAIAAGIECSLLYQWVRRYKIKGYEGLKDRKNLSVREKQFIERYEKSALIENEDAEDDEEKRCAG